MEEGKAEEAPVVEEAASPEAGETKTNENAEVEEATTEEGEKQAAEEIENTTEPSEEPSPEETEEPIQECSSIESIDSDEEELARICSPSLKQNYKNYLALVKEINTQNKVIQKIKADIQSVCCKAKRSQCDKCEIRALRYCLSEENDKLMCLMRKAIELQSHDPSRRFKNINLETSLEEDMMVVEANNSGKSKNHDPNLSEDEDMERLQKAVDKMQRSIETMEVTIKKMKGGEKENI